MTAAELLRDARRRHGLTQRQLAARARTSQAAISRIERGLVSPTVGTLAPVVDYTVIVRGGPHAPALLDGLQGNSW